MTPSLDRLDRASDTLAETVVDRARDDVDLDLTTLEQLAYDVALDDPVLGDLCEMIEDLRQLGEERQRARDGDSLSRVEQRILSAGISIDDAILARIDRLADEIIESERDRMIDDSVQIMTDGGTCRDGTDREIDWNKLTVPEDTAYVYLVDKEGDVISLSPSWDTPRLPTVYDFDGTPMDRFAYEFYDKTLVVRPGYEDVELPETARKLQTETDRSEEGSR